MQWKARKWGENITGVVVLCLRGVVCEMVSVNENFIACANTSKSGPYQEQIKTILSEIDLSFSLLQFGLLTAKRVKLKQCEAVSLSEDNTHIQSR